MTEGLPDHFTGTIFYGNADGTLTKIKVDSDGQFYALLKAMYGTAATDVTVDSAGRLTINVATQDLAEVITRPKYGAADGEYSNTLITAHSPAEEEELISVAGKGVLYGGTLSVVHTSTQANSAPLLRADGAKVCNAGWKVMHDHRIVDPRMCAVYLKEYDPIGFRYVAAFREDTTFENTLSVHYMDNHNSTPRVFCGIYYALI